MVGGESKLKQAVARGAVKIHREGSVELFSFPSRETSRTDEVKHAVGSTGESALTDAQHQQFKALKLTTCNLSKLRFVGFFFQN